MTLSREVVVPGMLAEYKSFSELVGGLSGEDWETPSRCEGWRVADVAAHVVGQLTDVVNLRLEGLGTPEVTQRQVDERRGKTPSELAAELESNVKVAGDLISAFDDGAWEAPGPTGVQGTLGSGIEALWFDTFLHADDMRSAIGRTSARGDGLRPSLSHIAQALSDQGWGPAVLHLEGFEEFPVSGGGGRIVTGDAFGFILASTGRGDPAAFGLDDSVNIYR
ncbi:MAG: maleylpyruvate isomerase family mycothiol-dependent enzyme [Acidimicrobiales bacterium]|jgi:uncharacterized protein (TIGR03083 family)